MITFPSYLTGFSSRSDGSASLRFTTQELTSDQFKLLKDNLNGFGYLVFKENPISTSDIPQEPAEEDKNKSPSKRYKAVLFVEWKQLADKKLIDMDFNTFYAKDMEVLIEKRKERLE